MKKFFLGILKSFFFILQMTGKFTLFTFETIGEKGWSLRKAFFFTLITLGPITLLNGAELAHSWVGGVNKHAPNVASFLNLIHEDGSSLPLRTEVSSESEREYNLVLDDGSSIWLDPHIYEFDNFFGLLKLSQWKRYPPDIQQEVFKIAFCESTLKPNNIQEYQWGGKLRKDVGFTGIWEDHDELLDFENHYSLTDGLTNLNAAEQLYRLRGGWFPSWKASRECFSKGPNMNDERGRDGWNWAKPLFQEHLYANKQQIFASN